jgi:drug/metabolite transporter (DMT)-like permease
VNKNEDSSGASSALGRDRRNRRSVTIWSVAWALAFMAATFGIKKFDWTFEGTLAAVIGTAILGLGTVLAYRRYLGETDELRRKIEVEALALAFGVGVFGGFSCWLLAVSGALEVEDFAFVFSAMVLTHALGVLLGCRRYS